MGEFQLLLIHLEFSISISKSASGEIPFAQLLSKRKIKNEMLYSYIIQI